MNMTAKWISFAPKIHVQMRGRIAVEINRTVLKVGNDSKRLTPVDTGQLRRTQHGILATPANLLGAWVAPMPYAPPVEFGTSRQQAQPFLQPATEKNKDDHRKRLKKAVWGFRF